MHIPVLRFESGIFCFYSPELLGFLLGLGLYTISRARNLAVQFHPHPASLVNGEASNFPPLAGGIEGGG